MKRIIHWLNLKARREARRIRQEAEANVAEQDHLRRIFVDNPELHAIIMLRGRRNEHYLLLDDLARIWERSANKAEINSLKN